MQLGQVVTRIEYITNHYYPYNDYSVPLEELLNKMASDGWLLHSMHQETFEGETRYLLVWQKFINVPQGIIG